jgi:hypothetical protein
LLNFVIKVDMDSESDYSSSDYDTDDEQNTNNKFRLVLCHHYHDALHGKPKDANVMTHYLVIETFKRFDISQMRDMSDFYNTKYKEQPATKLKHKIVRNYSAIVTGDYVKPEIAECFELPDHECVCIKKTFWLRLIQRAWKRVFKERRAIIKQLSTPLSLLNRSTKHTKAPILPGLHGLMLFR